MRELKILRTLTFLGLIFLPIFFKKQPRKEWMLVFLLKAVYSIFFDSFVVKYGQVSYPVRLLPKIFKVNLAFDMVLFPIACVIYNQITYGTKNILNIMLKAFYISVPIIVIEIWIEKNTKLLKYKGNWSWFISFYTLTFSFWIVRLTIGLIRIFDKPKKEVDLKSGAIN
ncbi:CBO0543 family protein [Bacillus salitolerans]|uniref:CBO0543 family protein n=1 Tax=Bacillus salitolerans TaxID=1437434 RepID=A0ABW4LWS7_9BACI